jgi:type VI secretion system secreted protein Hcp
LTQTFIEETIMALNAYLKIDGIDGESQDKGHPGWIEVMSFSWGMEQTGNNASGGGGGAGKVVVHDISISKRVDSSSPVLMKSCASGQHLKIAQLDLVRKGDRQQTFLVIKLQDVLVSSFRQDGNSDSPTESLSLNFTKLEESFIPNDDRGGVGNPIVGGVETLGGSIGRVE